MGRYMTVCMVVMAWLLFFHAGISGMTRRLMDEDELLADASKLDNIELGIFLFTLGYSALPSLATTLFPP
jgi:hypothetical protein